MIKFKVKKVKIAVTQEIIEGFQNLKKDVTTDIQENKSKQVEHFCLFRIRIQVWIRIRRISKSMFSGLLYSFQFGWSK